MCEFNADSIFTHILELMENPDLRAKYGNAASQKVRENLDELKRFLRLIEPIDQETV